jgi:hypothetical protein
MNFIYTNLVKVTHLQQKLNESIAVSNRIKAADVGNIFYIVKICI